MTLTITYHHISPLFAKSLPKIVSPNSLGFPGFPPFSVVGDIYRPQTFRRFAMEVKVPLARSTKHVMWRVCRWWSVRCNEKTKKNPPTNDQPNQWTEPTTQRKTELNPFFLMVLGWWRDTRLKTVKIKDCYQVWQGPKNFPNEKSRVPAEDAGKIQCFFKYLIWKKCRISAIRWIRHKHKRLHLTLHIEVWLQDYGTFPIHNFPDFLVGVIVLKVQKIFLGILLLMIWVDPGDFQRKFSGPECDPKCLLARWGPVNWALRNGQQMII